MGEINQILREEMFTHDGKTVVLRPSTFGTRGKFETWLENRALQKINFRRGQFDPFGNPLFTEEGYRIAISEWTRDCASGAYDYNGDTSRKATEESPGFRRLMFLLVDQSQPNAFTEAQVNEMVDFGLQQPLNDDSEGICAAWRRLNKPNPTTPPESAPGAKDSAS